MTDAGHMRRALLHAARAEGVTTPNPLVGAVVVSPDGVILGQGRHARAGEPHAEVNALDEAGEAARGSTLYVTLEPCCTVGRTGPCTTRILAAGVRRVVAAMRDPNPRVDGRGLQRLREAGVIVEEGLLGAEARRLNAPFTMVQTAGRPLVITKAAMSLDGRSAAAPGERTRITGAVANRRTQRLRAAMDAVGVGAGTVLADDPLLTVRETVRLRPLPRVVFDRSLRTPPTARLLSTLDEGPVIILTSPAGATSAPDRVRALERAGATVVPVEGGLDAALAALVPFDVMQILIEGGARLHRALWDADLVDRLHAVVAPVAFGSGALEAFGGAAVPAGRLAPVSVLTCGPDTWMEMDVHRTHRG
ncbi:MAG: bifunctional diaminohydroxyphosphoribosylaminopyrimidine deaminase/5-amino-6-(5-phosphoribosylamino)uracil reductase RibD [Vicinamibacterales bacterium]